MTPVTQTRTGENGNCMAACLASILEIPLSSIPDFSLDSDRQFFADIQDFLAKRGLYYVQFNSTSDMNDVFAAGPVYHTIEGISPRSGPHAVVGLNGEIIWDPHPQDGTRHGLDEVKSYGLICSRMNNPERFKQMTTDRQTRTAAVLDRRRARLMDDLLHTICAHCHKPVDVKTATRPIGQQRSSTVWQCPHCSQYNAEPNRMSDGQRATDEDLYSSIQNGDRVTIVTPHGNKLIGRAVMRGPAGWVLNLGGKHGTPGIASPENVIAVRKASKDGPFQKLENKLAHEKNPPSDPAAVAASIGRKELGQAEMTRRSEAGREKDAKGLCKVCGSKEVLVDPKTGKPTQTCATCAVLGVKPPATFPGTLKRPVRDRAIRVSAVMDARRARLTDAENVYRFGNQLAAMRYISKLSEEQKAKAKLYSEKGGWVVKVSSAGMENTKDSTEVQARQDFERSVVGREKDDEDLYSSIQNGDRTPGIASPENIIAVHKASKDDWPGPSEAQERRSNEIRQNAKAALQPGNNYICLKCHAQGKTERDVHHQSGCPASSIPPMWRRGADCTARVSAVMDARRARLMDSTHLLTHWEGPSGVKVECRADKGAFAVRTIRNGVVTHEEPASTEVRARTIFERTVEKESQAKDRIDPQTRLKDAKKLLFDRPVANRAMAEEKIKQLRGAFDKVIEGDVVRYYKGAEVIAYFQPSENWLTVQPK